MGFPCGSVEKNLPAMQETGFCPWVQKISWRRATCSGILSWEIHSGALRVGYNLETKTNKITNLKKNVLIMEHCHLWCVHQATYNVHHVKNTKLTSCHEAVSISESRKGYDTGSSCPSLRKWKQQVFIEYFLCAQGCVR